MEIKAKDMCPRYKYCLGMTPQGMYSCGYANDGSELNIGIDVTLSCKNFKEVNMNKVEGKVSDICPNCKNCKGMSWGVYDEKNDGLTEVECEDPYDGMTKTLDADSNVCCSMFEMKSEKKEKDSCDKISLLPHKLEMGELRMKIHQLEKEKADNLKGIERLKKSQEKLQNQVKNLQTINKGLAETKKSNDSWRERYYEIRYALRKDETLDESISCVRDIPSDVEVIEDLKKRAADSDYYKEKSELLEERNNNQFNTIREKNKKISELESRRTYLEKKALENAADLQKTKNDRDKWRKLYNSLSETCADAIFEKNSEFKQTISDQGVTIRALLITIKEICKED